MDMKILGASVVYADDDMDIDALNFLKDNPRVYAVTHGEAGFDQMTQEEQQNTIFEKLQNEPSVKNLVGEIERHGGLIERVLVRVDTKEVIEGNSRLAAYRILRNKDRDGDWDRIPCHVISTLTDDQQAALLHQVHVKGKTQWSAYEKANFAYVRKTGGWSVARIATVFGESPATIYKRIKAITIMAQSGDNKQKHFSYYDVIVRNPAIYNRVSESTVLRERLFDEIRNVGSGNAQKLTAQDLRKGFPAIIERPRVLSRYVNGEIDFAEASERATVSPAEKRVRRALSLLDEISASDVDDLRSNSVNSLRQAVKKLDRETVRIRRMIGMGDPK